MSPFQTAFWILSGINLIQVHQCPIYPSLRARKQGVQETKFSGYSHHVCTSSPWPLNTHLKPPIPNTDGQKEEIGSPKQTCSERGTVAPAESENRWHQHSFTLEIVCERHKEISVVSSLSASSLTAQILSLWHAHVHCPNTQTVRVHLNDKEIEEQTSPREGTTAEKWFVECWYWKVASPRWHTSSGASGFGARLYKATCLCLLSEFCINAPEKCKKIKCT